MTRRFLVGSSVPPEFSHALSVAFNCPEDGGDALAGGEGVGGQRRGVGGSGGAVEGCGERLVASELPLPEERPDHARYNRTTTLRERGIIRLGIFRACVT